MSTVMSRVETEEVNVFKPNPLAIAVSLVLVGIFAWTYVDSLQYIYDNDTDAGFV